MLRNLLTILVLQISLLSFGQVTGNVIDGATKEPLIGAKLIASDGSRAITGLDGDFKLNVKNYPVSIVVTMLQYDSDTIVVDAPGKITIELMEPVTSLETVVISAGRRKQAVEEVQVSMEIIRPELIDNKGITDLEEAVNQSPGVFTMDGQVSIRGGSGFAYGAGSRVLLLWNGMPLMSGYAGDTQWNSIPMEQASQIEIMKGASSVLYGSGALNGVIALTEREPGLKQETRLKFQAGIYDNPSRASLKWWDRAPMFQQVEAYTGKMSKKFGYTVSTTLFRNDGFREGETEERARVSGTLFFRIPKYERLKMGVGYNYQIQKTGNFLIWESDEFGYTPSGGADTSNAASTLTFNLGHRLFIDPYVRYIDKKNNKHNFKNRMYFAANDNLTNPAQSNAAVINFTEYQFQKQFANDITLTAGVSNTYNVVFSELFGDHTSNNAAAYAQYEQKFGKLDVSAGLRLEYFEMDGIRGDSDFYISKKDSISIPVYPVVRTGFHYPLAKYTHLRGSVGQGIRYPSVAERFTQTNVGALNIFPNASLRPEIGWAAEIGIKQGVKIRDWKGMIDVSAFINEYQNMIEFTFGLYAPPGVILSTDPNSPGYINNFLGFQAQNAERARITGIEFSFNSTGKIGEFEIISLMGYTFMNPISLNTDSVYLQTFSDPTSNLLKYRFRHLAKADVEINYRKFSLGVSSRYNSFMSNIDRLFEISAEEFLFGVAPPAGQGTFILPGNREHRQRFNRGNLVFDARIGYKLNDTYRFGFIVNNVLNQEYVSRPGDIQAPRHFMVQVQMKL
jgi:outer membrane receptor protein involved in Fe transport